LNHVTRAQLAAQGNHLEHALVEAQTGVALAPRPVQPQAELGGVLRQLQRPEEARQAFQKAQVAAQTVHPEFQRGWAPELKRVALEGH
jgi:Flp pilus assembly protein TadD